MVKSFTSIANVLLCFCK